MERKPQSRSPLRVLNQMKNFYYTKLLKEDTKAHKDLCVTLRMLCGTS